MIKLVDVSKLATVATMGKLLNCTTQTVYNKIRRGDIKSVVIDGVIFCVNDRN